MQDAVGIDVEGDFDLRNAARGRWDIRQIELADGLVVTGQLPFTLEDVNFHAGLIVRSGRKYFRLAGRDSRIALDQFGEDAAQSLNSQ